MNLKARLLLVALAVTALALTVAGAAVYVLTSSGVTGTLDAAARAEASTVAAEVSAGNVPDPIPSSRIIQVLDARNRVVAASLTADRLTPLVVDAERSGLEHGGVTVVDASRVALSGQLRVVGQRVNAPDGVDLVVVAVPTTEAEAGSGILRRRLFVIFPLMLLATLLLAWRMIGSALAPVEALRRGAEQIGAASSARANAAGPGGPGGAVSNAAGASMIEQLPVPDTHDEVAALAITLNDMLARLAASRAKQRAFVADAAHELRSPLAVMRTELEVAERLGDGGELPALLMPEVARLTNLVEDLLTLARTADSPELTPEPVPVARFLDQVVERYHQARVPVVVVPAQESAPAGTPIPGNDQASGQAQEVAVWVAPADLLRAVTNLVDNAVRHANSQVRLSWNLVQPGTGSSTPLAPRGPNRSRDRNPEQGPDPARVQIRVSDDGAGITEQDRERVFDRFARLDEARDRDRGGSGLGLPIARELLQRNDASLELQDAAPGLCAVLTLVVSPSGGPGA